MPILLSNAILASSSQINNQPELCIILHPTDNQREFVDLGITDNDGNNYVTATLLLLEGLIAYLIQGNILGTGLNHS